MRLFSKLFSKHPASSVKTSKGQVAAQSVTLPSEEAVEQMSPAELKSLIDPEGRTLPKTVTVGFLGAMYRRAMEIAYHSHGTSIEDRNVAAIIAKATREGMLSAGQNEDICPLKSCH